MEASKDTLVARSLAAADAVLRQYVDEPGYEVKPRAVVRLVVAVAWVEGRHQGGMEARTIVEEAMTDLLAEAQQS